MERVRNRGPGAFKYLSGHGIQLGITAKIAEIAPFRMIMLRPDDKEDSIGLPEEVAQSVYAHPLERESNRS